jgi:hypothetical protein
MQVVEDDEQRRQHRLDQSHEQQVGERLAEETGPTAAQGDIRCASSTRLRSSRVQAWLSAVTEAKSSATHRIPPAIWRDMAAVGSNANEKTTTTSSEKNSIPLIESRERHSSCRSLRRWVKTWPK